MIGKQKGGGLFFWGVLWGSMVVGFLGFAGVFGDNGEKGAIADAPYFEDCGSVNWEDIIDTLSFFVVQDFGFRGGNSMPVKEGKVLVELKIFDSGEGYIVVGNKRGKLWSFDLWFNVETLCVTGEDYSLKYRTAYSGWGDWYPHRLDLYEPQDCKKNITEEFLGE